MDEEEIEYCKKDYETVNNYIENKVRKDLCLNMIMDLLYSAIKITSKNEPTLDSYNLKDDCLMYLLEQFDKERFNITVEMKRQLNDEY